VAAFKDDKTGKWEVSFYYNPRVYKALRNQLAEVYAELSRIEFSSDVSPELTAVMALIFMKGKNYAR
jgi:hypothetical protein